MVTALRNERMELIHIEANDPAATTLVAGLLKEITARAGSDAPAEGAAREHGEFAPWFGRDLLVLVEAGLTLAGGWFRRYDSTTVELGSLWTRPDRRRRGLARRIVAELENAAARSGFQRAYAVAGPGRPEARALLSASGYTPLGGLCQHLDYLGFVKALDRT
jgi:GNAT superfamily N-acetyltransferase